MKQFKNQATEVAIPDEEKSTPKKYVPKDATYADLALICVRAPKEGGFGVEEMRKRFRIIEALDGLGPNASVKLEDQDAAHLTEICTEFKWNLMHKDIITFIDYVGKLKKVAK
jgi:hypothetical protein